MSRAVAEQSSALSIFWLKKHGYLDKDYSQQAGSITWTYGSGDNKGGIRFTVIRDNWGTPEEKTYIRLSYTHTNYWTGEKNEMDYNINLTTTPCNFGGIRYWFVCPLHNNEIYCGRRVGVLYVIGKWFGCRHCGNIAYQAQFAGGRFRAGSVCEVDVERVYEEAKTQYYNGKPTRKYRRYLRLRDKMDDNWMKLAVLLGKK